jgi:hypothetical protein
MATWGRIMQSARLQPHERYVRVENVSRLPAFGCKTHESVLSEHQATATGYISSWPPGEYMLDRFYFLTDRRKIHAKIGLRAVPGGSALLVVYSRRTNHKRWSRRRKGLSTVVRRLPAVEIARFQLRVRGKLRRRRTKSPSLSCPQYMHIHVIGRIACCSSRSPTAQNKHHQHQHQQPATIEHINLTPLRSDPGHLQAKRP